MFCTKCEKDKLKDCFYENTGERKSNGGRRPFHCIDCILENNRRRNAVRRKDHRDKLNCIKLERGCIDCGYKINPSALHFDHKSNKRFGLAQSMLYSWDTILKEIAKCDIRCANCHAIRHDNERKGIGISRSLGKLTKPNKLSRR